MPKRTSGTGSELFIVDNSDQEWKVLRYLRDWCPISKAIDVATGFFEIGSLLALDGEWQKVDRIRLLMGGEVSFRTRAAFVEGLGTASKRLDQSIEEEKQKNDFLAGVPAIVDGIRTGRIVCRVYRKEKFHAKAYVTHARLAVVGSSALVGSSNLTLPGITENVELNVQITGAPVAVLQEWYEEHWNEAEDVTPEILKVIERHIREFTPFEVYAKALQEYFRGHEMTATEWEMTQSKVYPVLDHYQKDGYHSLLKIARQYNGAFLCDGVGLGKTFVGLMLIERLTEYDRKRVVLFVPKAARKPVWEAALSTYLPHLGGDFSNFVIYNHTDLSRGETWQERLGRLKDTADVFIVDEAHHFRNPGIKGEGEKKPSRYRRFFDIAEGKTLFLITATPVNNRLIDLQHMIELFSRREADYFASKLGIHSLPGHFRKMEKALEKVVAGVNGGDGYAGEITLAEAEKVLSRDDLFRAIVVQRSRAYVKESQKQREGRRAIFPVREAPKVADYSVKKTYGRLLDMVERAFSKQKPLFSLAVYYPLAYYKGDDATIDPLDENRQIAVVSLIRTQFLKRFESSATAFQMSCQTLLWKLLAFVEKHSTAESERKRFKRWKDQHSELLGLVHKDQIELFDEEEPEQESDADAIIEEIAEDLEDLSREEYKVEEILAETYLDLNQIVEFLEELKKFKPSHDDKLRALIGLLKRDKVLKQHKVLIFTEYLATARYLQGELEKEGYKDLDEVDSKTKRDRGQIIGQFAPYYNDSSSAKLEAEGLSETRILISTDVLSEGLNLQDATRIINYDIHWNPVRLMQRIGRVDRRMNPDIEAAILADHPEQQDIRGKVAFWNFLPPDELDRLLHLYSLVSHKTLRISKTFGIEGRKLLRPEDDYEALREFSHAYEGTTTSEEAMHLEYQQLLKDNPELEDNLNSLPLRVFSGKEHPSKDSKAVFFCYSLPALDVEKQDQGITDTEAWTEEAGYTQWYLYDLETEKIWSEPSEIIDLIRSTPDTPRRRTIEDETLSRIRAKVDKHIKNTYLKSVQAPVGVKPILKAWMELN